MMKGYLSHGEVSPFSGAGLAQSCGGCHGCGALRSCGYIARLFLGLSVACLSIVRDMSFGVLQAILHCVSGDEKKQSRFRKETGL